MAIGTTAAVLGAAAIGGVASVAGGMIENNAATEAARAQEDAAVSAARIQADASNRAVDISDRQYQQSRTDALPWMEAGKTALKSYLGELGLSDEAKAGTFKSGFKETPGYAYQVAEGEKGVVNNLAALGLKGSGAALKALTRFRQNLADQTYNNYLTRVGNVATGGQQAVNDNAVLGAQNAANTGSAIIQSGNAQAGGVMDAGAARASGYVGSANAWNNALGNVANTGSNALGWLSGNRGWAA